MGTPDRLRDDARAIFRAGLDAADPARLLGDGFHEQADGWRYREGPLFAPPGPAGRVRLFGAGKAAAALAGALSEKLGGRLHSGRVVVKYGHGQPIDRVVVEEGAHPLPDAAGASATRRLLRDLDGGRAEDRIFFALTGGASALLVAPADGLTLDDKIATTDLLLRSGATIQEMNAVRKHLSAVKGGRLLERMAPARALVLVVSDVLGDDLSSIGSGPAVADPTTFADALDVLRRYGLEARAPASVRERLRAGAAGEIPETPKPGAALLGSVRHVVLANNDGSVDAAAVEAGALGYDVEIFGRRLEGNAHERARAFAERLLALARSGGRRALLAGGELTLEVRGTGLGGRNQEFALVAGREMERCAGVVLLAAGTDGTDGPTDAAGAFADGGTWERAHAAGRDPEEALANNDAYPLFDALGDLLRTGPTGTNVNDLAIGLTSGDQRG